MTTLCIEFDKVAGDILDTLLRLLLEAIPSTCAKG